MMLDQIDVTTGPLCSGTGVPVAAGETVECSCGEQLLVRDGHVPPHVRRTATGFHAALETATQGLSGGSELCDAFARSFRPDPIGDALGRLGAAAARLVEKYLLGCAADRSFSDDDRVLFVVDYQETDREGARTLTMCVRSPQPGDTAFLCATIKAVRNTPEGRGQASLAFDEDGWAATREALCRRIAELGALGPADFWKLIWDGGQGAMVARLERELRAMGGLNNDDYSRRHEKVARR